LIREALRRLFGTVGLRVQTFGSASELLESAFPDAPSCLVLDIRLPGRSGLDLQAELVKAGVRVPIVFMSGHGDIPMTVRAMKAGAVDFLTKPFRDQDLLDAIQRGIRLDRERRAEAARLVSLQQRYATLSPREREVMSMVAEGLANKQIAAALDLKEITVKVHRAQVMRKLEAKSLPELARIADRLKTAMPAQSEYPLV
jgi:FixJ family two-component response regulator